MKNKFKINNRKIILILIGIVVLLMLSSAVVALALPVAPPPQSCPLYLLSSLTGDVGDGDSVQPTGIVSTLTSIKPPVSGSTGAISYTDTSLETHTLTAANKIDKVDFPEEGFTYYDSDKDGQADTAIDKEGRVFNSYGDGIIGVPSGFVMSGQASQSKEETFTITGPNTVTISYTTNELDNLIETHQGKIKTLESDLETARDEQGWFSGLLGDNEKVKELEKKLVDENQALENVLTQVNTEKGLVKYKKLYTEKLENKRTEIMQQLPALQADLEKLNKEKKEGFLGLFRSKKQKEEIEAKEEAIEKIQKELQENNRRFAEFDPNSKTALANLAQNINIRNYEQPNYFSREIKRISDGKIFSTPAEAREARWAAFDELVKRDPRTALESSHDSKRITDTDYERIKKELDEIEEKGRKEDKTGADIKTEKAEYASKELKRMESLTKITQQKAYELTSQLLNMLLGGYAQEMVADLCKEEWDSSEPASNKPLNVNPGPNDLSTMNSSQLIQSAACGSSDKTTMSAQGTRTGGSPYTYDISWSITACKQDIQYTVYLANTKDDKEAVEFGTVNKGKTVAGTKQFQNSKGYTDVCIQVSDTSVGDNGFACFSLVI